MLQELLPHYSNARRDTPAIAIWLSVVIAIFGPSCAEQHHKGANNLN
jgi:hypothetical protein